MLAPERFHDQPELCQPHNAADGCGKRQASHHRIAKRLGEMEIRVAADQKVGAVSKIQNAAYAEDQREAHGDQGVEAAEQKALDQDLHHAACRRLASSPDSAAGSPLTDRIAAPPRLKTVDCTGPERPDTGLRGAAAPFHCLAGRGGSVGMSGLAAGLANGKGAGGVSPPAFAHITLQAPSWEP